MNEPKNASLPGKSDPEAKRIELAPRADVVVEKTKHISAEVHTRDESAKQRDLYTELTKLDDLRKKGILSGAEFDAEKKKLLEQSR